MFKDEFKMREATPSILKEYDIRLESDDYDFNIMSNEPKRVYINDKLYCSCSGIGFLKEPHKSLEKIIELYKLEKRYGELTSYLKEVSNIRFH